MTTAAAPTLSAAAFLFDDDQDSVGRLADALKESGVLGTAIAGLGKLSKAGMDAVGDQIASIGNELLDMGLDTLILEGWRKFEDVHAAAQRTRAASGSSEVLDLASHSITSTHQPRVELRLDDIPIAAVEFGLSLTFVLKAVVATVRDGSLVSLHSGVCDVEGALAVGDKPLAKRSGHFQLPLMVQLGSGVPLLIDDGLTTVVVTEAIDAKVVDDADVAATAVGTAEPPASEVTEDVSPAPTN
jgi:hypothetical protein